MKMTIRALIVLTFFFSMLNFTFAADKDSDKATLIIMYDSQIHELTNVPTIFFVSKNRRF